MQWFFVFYYFGESANGSVKAVIGRVVINSAYFSDKNFPFAFFAVKTMIDALFKTDALGRG